MGTVKSWEKAAPGTPVEPSPFLTGLSLVRFGSRRQRVLHICQQTLTNRFPYRRGREGGLLSFAGGMYP